MYKGKGQPTTRLRKHDVEAEVLFLQICNPTIKGGGLSAPAVLTPEKNLGIHYLEDCVNSTPVLQCFV